MPVNLNQQLQNAQLDYKIQRVKDRTELDRLDLQIIEAREKDPNRENLDKKLLEQRNEALARVTKPIPDSQSEAIQAQIDQITAEKLEIDAQLERANADLIALRHNLGAYKASDNLEEYQKTEFLISKRQAEIEALPRQSAALAAQLQSGPADSAKEQDLTALRNDYKQQGQVLAEELRVANTRDFEAAQAQPPEVPMGTPEENLNQLLQNSRLDYDIAILKDRIELDRLDAQIKALPVDRQDLPGDLLNSRNAVLARVFNPTPDSQSEAIQAHIDRITTHKREIDAQLERANADLIALNHNLGAYQFSGATELYKETQSYITEKQAEIDRLSKESTALAGQLQPGSADPAKVQESTALRATYQQEHAALGETLRAANTREFELKQVEEQLESPKLIRDDEYFWYAASKIHANPNWDAEMQFGGTLHVRDKTGNFSYKVSPSTAGRGTTYNPDLEKIKNKAERARYLQAMCEAAVQNALPGTKFEVEGEAGSKEVVELQAALRAALAKYPPQPIPPNAPVPEILPEVVDRRAPPPAPPPPRLTPVPPAPAPAALDSEQVKIQAELKKKEAALLALEMDIAEVNGELRYLTEMKKVNMQTAEGVERARIDRDAKQNLEKTLAAYQAQKTQLDTELQQLRGLVPAPAALTLAQQEQVTTYQIELQKMEERLPEVNQRVRVGMEALQDRRLLFTGYRSGESSPEMEADQRKYEALQASVEADKAEKAQLRGYILALQQKIADPASVSPPNLTPPQATIRYEDPILGPQGGFVPSPVVAAAPPNPPMTVAYNKAKEDQAKLAQLVPARVLEPTVDTLEATQGLKPTMRPHQ